MFRFVCDDRPQRVLVVGKNITRAYKGGSFGNLSRFKPQDLSAAKARLVRCYGKQVPRLLLKQWACEWWAKHHGMVATSVREAEEELTLTGGEEFQFYNMKQRLGKFYERFGQKLSESELQQKAIREWKRECGISPAVPSSNVEEEITLTELKSASSLDKLLSQLCLSPGDVTILANLLEGLGGVTRAMKVLTNLRELRGIPKDDQEKSYAERSES